MQSLLERPVDAFLEMYNSTPRHSSTSRHPSVSKNCVVQNISAAQLRELRVVQTRNQTLKEHIFDLIIRLTKMLEDRFCFDMTLPAIAVDPSESQFLQCHTYLCVENMCLERQKNDLYWLWCTREVARKIKGVVAYRYVNNEFDNLPIAPLVN